MRCTPFLCAARSAGAFAAAAVLATIFAPAAPSRAEIDPKYYREWQDKAPEAVVIHVRAVTPDVTSQPHHSGQGLVVTTRVAAEAAVEKVLRTASALKPGDTIRIAYVTRRAEPMEDGPRPIPVLQRGETYTAFLLGVSKGVYAPAARGASFILPVRRE